MRILGIETSCDETSAAVMIDGELKSNIISSQVVHQRYGGIVPELASRAHQQLIVPIVDEALSKAGIGKRQIDGIAVTYGPGLAGALLVGLNFAKALAFGLNIPFIGVNHLEAHIYSNFIDEPRPEYPFLCLIVSGGHTQLVIVRKPLTHELLGETLDDAAGEAYDKVGKMLGLGFPGGPAIDRLAAKGNPGFVKFRRPHIDDSSYNFSFSGIKTSMLYWLRDHQLLSTATEEIQIDENMQSDLCASFQAAVVDVLVEKTSRAVKQFSIKDVGIAGGVSANSELRRRMQSFAKEKRLELFLPKLQYCPDNAAMIAKAGELRFAAGMNSAFDLHAVPNLSLI